MAVDVDDAQCAVDLGGDPPDERVADRVIAAEGGREDAPIVDVAGGLVDLGEGLAEV